MEEGHGIPAMPHYPDYWEGNEGEHSMEWSPSTDIAAAWEVIDKSNAFAELFNNPTKRIWAVRFEGGNWVRGDTAPLAICRAALLAVR